MTPEQKYMKRALELAVNGSGSVSPNPMVGCVIVFNDKIIGEGWHHTYGESHAEVMAVKAVMDKSVLNKSEVYINLEPCAHHGNTPPCSEMLVDLGVRKVIIANMDPNPMVNGRGLQKLESSDIEVVTGIMSEEAARINKRFFCYHKNKRPYIILKWAQTRDGYIARGNYDSKWISNSYSRQLVHKWRAEEDAVLVGANTVLYDDPMLTVRSWNGRDPLRIYIDKGAKIDIKKFNLGDGSVDTICYTEKNVNQQKNVQFVTLADVHDPGLVMNDLYKRQVLSLLVEGGAELLQSFIDSKEWDEARVFTGNASFGTGVQAPRVRGQRILEDEVTGDKLEIIINR